MTIDAEAYWATAPDEGALRQTTLAPPSTTAEPAEVLIETLYSGVSRGSEALVAGGRVPPSQHTVMRCPFQEGAFPFPVKYGYSNVGTVLAGPSELVGRTVFCLYPHQTRYVVPAAAVHVLPDALPARRAVLTANLETALNAVWDATLLPGERIVVIGAGVVGCLIARLAVQLPGADVTLVDTDPAKAEIADALGVPFRTAFEPDMAADCLINASAAPAALAAAMGAAGLEARIVEVSWYGDAVVPLPLGEAFHSRRLRLVASQVGNVSSAVRARFDHGRRLVKVMDILAQDDCLEALIDGQTAFRDLPRAMPQLMRGKGLCHAVRYERASP